MIHPRIIPWMIQGSSHQVVATIDEYDSDDSIPGPSSHATNNKRPNDPGPSGLSTSKRPRLDSKCLMEEPEAEQHSSVRMQQDDNLTPEPQQADIGNRVQPGIFQPTLRDLSASVWGNHFPKEIIYGLMKLMRPA